MSFSMPGKSPCITRSRNTNRDQIIRDTWSLHTALYLANVDQVAAQRPHAQVAGVIDGEQAVALRRKAARVDRTHRVRRAHARGKGGTGARTTTATGIATSTATGAGSGTGSGAEIGAVAAVAARARGRHEARGLCGDDGENEPHEKRRTKIEVESAVFVFLLQRYLSETKPDFFDIQWKRMVMILRRLCFAVLI